MKRFTEKVFNDPNVWSNRSREDWSMLGYYVGCIAIGIVAVYADDIYNFSGYGDVWAIGLALVGAAGALSLLDRSYRAESIIIKTIALLTLAQALMVFAVGGEASLQIGLRLMIAPLMIVPYSVHRSRRVPDIAKLTHIIGEVEKETIEKLKADPASDE